MKNWQKIKTNPSLKTRFLMREKLVDALRLFFKQNHFHEVETPLMVSVPSTEPYFNLFETKLQFTDGREKPAYLISSPEYAMKKLLAAGFGNIFQICKAFRNQESLGIWHNPEFTILEFYRVQANYFEVMDDFAKMLQFICQSLKIDEKKFVYQGKTFDLSAPYPRFSVAELFQKYLNLNEDQLFDLRAICLKALQLGYDLTGLQALSKDLIWEEVYNQLFLNEIEPQLAQFNQPVIVYDYPALQSALAQRTKKDSRFAERFEVYLAGMELGNAFGELIDADLQKEGLEKDLLLRRDLGKEPQSVDQDFLDALQSGLPKCSGMAVGVDRLAMLFSDVSDINDVLLFPMSELFLD
jgi:lysyl-tRNA synthetase class 2